MKNNVCLITGGAGFLGTKYCEFFLKKNYKVLCIDNHKSNLKKLSSIKSKNLHTFICDITNEKSVKLLFNKINKNFFVNVLINNATIDAVPFSDQKNVSEKKTDITNKTKTVAQKDREKLDEKFSKKRDEKLN